MTIALKRTTDMPVDSQGRRIISGAAWDNNCTTLENKLNGGITGADVSTTPGEALTDGNIDPDAAISGSKLAGAAITDREIDYTAVRNNLTFWMLR